MKTSPPNAACKKQPIAEVVWVHPSELRANDYNPNKVFGPELQLLKLSILENGWTQPIVARRSGEIVDGFHRFTLGSTDWQVLALTDGLVPVVFLDDATDPATQKLATIRHNRARGQHGILKMGSIVRSLIAEGLTKDQVMERLQMEEEEFDRLAETKGAPDRIGQDSFGLGWVPDTPDQSRPVHSVPNQDTPPDKAGNGAPDDSKNGATPGRCGPQDAPKPSKRVSTARKRPTAPVKRASRTGRGR